MTEPPSVVVVGAGAIGLCTAFELHELGVRDITVLEKRHVASASSGLAVGIIETQYLDPVPIAIRVYSMEFFGRLEREAACPSPATATSGSPIAPRSSRSTRGASRSS